MSLQLEPVEEQAEQADIPSEPSCNNRLSCLPAILLASWKTLHCNRRGKMSFQSALGVVPLASAAEAQQAWVGAAA